MSVDILRVTSIKLQGHDEPLAMGLPDGLRLDRLECNSPLDHSLQLYLTFVAETVDPILLALRQMLVGAVITIEMAQLRFRGPIIHCTADHLAPPLLEDDRLFPDEDIPVLHVTVRIIGDIQRLA